MRNSQSNPSWLQQLTSNHQITGLDQAQNNMHSGSNLLSIHWSFPHSDRVPTGLCLLHHSFFLLSNRILRITIPYTLALLMLLMPMFIFIFSSHTMSKPVTCHLSHHTLFQYIVQTLLVTGLLICNLTLGLLPLPACVALVQTSLRYPSNLLLPELAWHLTQLSSSSISDSAASIVLSH